MRSKDAQKQLARTSLSHKGAIERAWEWVAISSKQQNSLFVFTQLVQARYMSSSMLAFALLRNSSDLHSNKDLYGE